MRILLFLALLCFGASYSSVLYSPCSSGPKFWCSNLANAKLCGAVSHCIQTVWENEEVAEDTDSVCQICLDMVKQARDQLESNETISDLKAVFEGSCKLIPVKPVQKECIKLADDFIPELVEALASQMNPQMVCSVAGLCNNAAIDKMLEEQKKKPVYVGKSLTCNNCNVLSNSIIEKFNNTHRDQVLDNIQDLCGKMSSFSDACNSIVLTHFNTFYQQIQEKISSDAVCHMSGVCSWKFHSHAENDDMKELSSEVVAGDDLPCELCQQLVRHLRDVLIANTTEDEFKQVLQGLCGQTKGFKTECLSIVDEYYKIIYETLVNNLDASGACFLIGICPKGETVFKPIAPAKIDVKITKLETVPSLSNEEISSMQKPLNSLFETEMSTHLVENGELCTLCEYFMHFVQETLTLPSNEKKIKDDLKLICSKSMPKTLKGECDDFVDMYGDAVVALLVQEIDPRQICPFMRMCSPNTVEEEKEVTDKPSCPLCLFAVEQAQIKIKDDKTKENAIKVLNNLCNHFPNNKLKAECVDFVKTYTSELINLLVQDFTPQQICVAIKLCENNKFDLKSLGIEVVKKEIESNEEAPMPQCLLCKKVIELVEKELIGEKTKENIMEALRRTCSKLKRGQKNCNKFVEKYGELIADLILKEMKPDQICKELLYCLSEEEEMDEIEISIVSLPEEKQTDPPSCAVCEIIMTQMEHELKDKKTQDEIRAALQNVCHKIPSSLSEKCTKIIDDYTETILNLLNTIPPKQICQEIKLCSKKLTKIEKPTQDPQCTICELIMTQLEQELKDKKTKEEVKTALENICHKIPSKFSDKCSKIVDQYSDAILDMLDSVPPKEICSRMNLCAMNDISNDILECGVCQGVSAFLVSHKDTELTKNEMKDLTCDSFPSKYFDKCTEIIEYYSQSIQNLIKSNISENEICTKIGKCFDKEGKHSYQVVMNSHKSKRTLVGDNECTFGPSHWCKDKETAKKCDLVDYCEKIWKKKENKTA